MTESIVPETTETTPLIPNGANSIDSSLKSSLTTKINGSGEQSAESGGVLDEEAGGRRSFCTWQVEAAHDAHLALRQVQLNAAPLVHLQQHTGSLARFRATTSTQDAQLPQECSMLSLMPDG